MKKTLLFLITIPLLSLSMAQDLESALSSIEENNKTLSSARQELEARKMSFRAAQPLNNPTVELDLMKGFPESAGNQQDLLINQAFDFPTSYGIRKKLSSQLDFQYDFDYQATRQAILLEAKKTCLELIYVRKLTPRITERRAMTEKLLSDFETKLNAGDGNILDVNKARLQLIEINKDYQVNQALAGQLIEKLTGLNGGNALLFLPVDYPLGQSIGSVDDIYEEIQALDPELQFFLEGSASADKQVELAKSLALPKLEAGYRQQAILGQNFQGFHVAASIPLWENKYRVRQSEQEKILAQLVLEDYQNERQFKLRQQFEILERLGASVLEYQSVLLPLSDIEYLNKALTVGHISTIEYFLESNYFYTAYGNYLRTEFEYQLLMADILRHRL